MQKSNTHQHENVLCIAISYEVNYAIDSRPEGMKGIEKESLKAQRYYENGFSLCFSEKAWNHFCIWR